MFALGDIVLFILVAVFMLWGYRRGLIRTVIHLISVFVCGIITFVLFPFVKQAIQFNDLMEQLMDKMMQVGGSFVTADSLGFVCNILLAFLVFLCLRLVLSLLAKALDSVAKLPVLKQMNKLAGAVFGVLEGLLIVYLILGVLDLIQPNVGNLAIYEYINDSEYLKALYQNNILLNLIWK